MALNINGRMKVKTLRADFKKEFGLALRVYDGRSFADDNATLASIRKGDSVGGEFSPQRNTKVGNLEDKIMDMFGIKTQVSGSDDSYLCENDHTLAKALEADEKLMVKREKRGDKATPTSAKDEESVTEDNSQDSSDMSLEEIITEIKVVYKDHDDLEEIIEDLEDDAHLDHWAMALRTETFGKNEKLSNALSNLSNDDVIDNTLSDENSDQAQISIEDIGEEYNVFEKDMYDKYHPDNVLLIRDWFKRYLVDYSEGYKELIAKTSRNDGYTVVQEWIDDEYLDLFPTDLEIDSSYARQALDDMKEIAQNWITYLDGHNNMAPGPDNAEEIIPSRFFDEDDGFI